MQRQNKDKKSALHSTAAFSYALFFKISYIVA